jgi:hypothetical protein
MRVVAFGKSVPKGSFTKRRAGSYGKILAPISTMDV